LGGSFSGFVEQQLELGDSIRSWRSAARKVSVRQCPKRVRPISFSPRRLQLSGYWRTMANDLCPGYVRLPDWQIGR
jgi:hypothetical protein